VSRLPTRHIPLKPSLQFDYPLNSPTCKSLDCKFDLRLNLYVVYPAIASSIFAETCMLYTRPWREEAMAKVEKDSGQGLTLVHFSAQRKRCLCHKGCI